MADDPLDEWVGQAIDWLADHIHANLGFERALRQHRWRAAHTLSVYQTAHGLEGLAMAAPHGDWFVEALHATAAGSLAAMVSATTQPHVLTTSASTAEWIRPSLQRGAMVQREQTLRALMCAATVSPGQGRWAQEADIPVVRAAVTEAPARQRLWPLPDVAQLVARRRVAVLDGGPGLACVVVLDEETTHYACIADVLCGADARGLQQAGELIAFVAADLLQRRPAVHILLDADDAAMAAVLRARGFVDGGGCYRAWLTWDQPTPTP